MSLRREVPSTAAGPLEGVLNPGGSRFPAQQTLERDDKLSFTSQKVHEQREQLATSSFGMTDQPPARYSFFLFD
jgi:hypothetical protein